MGNLFTFKCWDVRIYSRIFCLMTVVIVWLVIQRYNDANVKGAYD